MIQLVRERLQLVAEGDEVDHVLIFVERTFDFDRDAVVVPVQPLAHIAIEGDEVRGAEDVLFFFEANAIGHRIYHRHGGGKSPSRKPAKRAAAIRSAVVPGLRRLPSRAKPEIEIGQRLIIVFIARLARSPSTCLAIVAARCRQLRATFAGDEAIAVLGDRAKGVYE